MGISEFFFSFFESLENGEKIILDDPDCERYISKWESIKNDINFIKNILR